MSASPILVDLHTHTFASHAKDSVAAMYAAALSRGLKVYGFSEHSPRPFGYDYPVEYRDRLKAAFPAYVQQVQALKDNTDGVQVLLGMEVDWIAREEEFVRTCIGEYPFEYLLGSVHFLDTWGFDASPQDWNILDEKARSASYHKYFLSLQAMARTNLFDIAAHPDLIKIFSVDSFTRWLAGDNLDVVQDTLKAFKKAGMSMEVSAAGLRKPCSSIYPAPVFMEMAFQLELPISFASDAHAVSHVAQSFDQLKAYAASFGYTSSVYFKNRQRFDVPFI